MELTPSVDYNLAGPNNLTTVETPLSDPKSVSKVINWENPVENYTGAVSFYYDNLDLNDLNESELAMIIRNDESKWNELASNLDVNAKSIIFDFEQPVSLTGFSASQKATLGSADIDETDLQLYPNPTASTLQINYPGDLEIEIFDMLGKSLMTTNKKAINLSYLAAGTYMIKILDVENNQSIVKKIIKK